MFCLTRFVVDATENSKGGVAAEVYSPQTGLFMILTFVHVCIRTCYVHDKVYTAKNKKETTP